MRCHIAYLSIAFLCFSGACVAQQKGDSEFEPRISKPVHAKGRGPTVAIDEAHGNYHTREGRYAAFAKLLEADGYRVTSHRDKVSASSLAKTRVLVIANAIPGGSARKWELPIPSAFSNVEIDTIVHFVREGGSLFLIADHMPFPGAIDKLARRFGVRFENGFNVTKKPDGGFQIERTIFRRSAESIASHPITDGRSQDERVDQVASFVGSVFRLDAELEGRRSARPLLVLPKGTVVLNPKRAWKFEKDTPEKDASGWLHGAAIEFGKGRVVVSAEAAMFTAQRSRGGGKMGLHTAIAKDNQKLLRNILRWLTPPRAGDKSD